MSSRAKAHGANTSFAAIEVLAQKLGYLLLNLGVIHFSGLYLEAKITTLERAELIAALQATGGNKSQAAERLGVSRRDF